MRPVLPLILVFLGLVKVDPFTFSPEYEDDVDFNLFIFTQWWPQTQCYEDVKNKTCVPSGISKWTIHGLWPTVGTEHLPVYCNKSWPFDEESIEDLKPELVLQWPSYSTPDDYAAFWKHEWEKHGTCATSLSFLSSEHKYFEVSLSLNIKYDIFKALNQGGRITPTSDKVYQVKDIEVALFKVFKVHPTVYCLPVKPSEQMLSYVELCFDKTLTPINCLNSTANCDYTKPVQYPPIIHAGLESVF